MSRTDNQHLEDGMLHELLDRDGEYDERLRIAGEHIARCAVCAQRLEDERAVRAEATTILLATSPVLRAAPSFESVLARSEAARGIEADAMGAGVVVTSVDGTHVVQRTPRRPRHRIPQYAWAATIVLAVGAVWIGRSIYSTEPAPGVVTEGAPVARQAAPPASDAADTGPAVENAAAGASATAATPAANPDAAVARTTDAPPAGSGSARDLAASSDVRGNVASTETRAELARAPAPPPVVAATSQAFAQSEAEAARSRMAAKSAAGATAADSAQELLSPASWRVVAREEATRVLGVEPLTAGGYVIVDYAVTDADARIRVRQRSPVGDTVEVIQRLSLPMRSLRTAPAAPPAPAPLPRNQIPLALRDEAVGRVLGGAEWQGRRYQTVAYADHLVTVVGRDDVAVSAAMSLIRAMAAERRK